jgi:hypothetical protein
LFYTGVKINIEKVKKAVGRVYGLKMEDVTGRNGITT